MTLALSFRSTVFCAACVCAGLPWTASAQSGGSANKPADDYEVNQRFVIKLNAQEQASLLTEMNEQLKAVSTIHIALSTKDFATIATTAKAMTLHQHEREKPGANFLAKVPSDWRSYGMPLRRGFTEVVAAATDSPSVDKVLAALAKTTQACVACHAQFKAVIVP